MTTADEKKQDPGSEKGALVDSELRTRIRERMRRWVREQDHYYVGYEFGSADDMSESFESLVDEVADISRGTCEQVRLLRDALIVVRPLVKEDFDIHGTERPEERLAVVDRALAATVVSGVQTRANDSVLSGPARIKSARELIGLFEKERARCCSKEVGEGLGAAAVLCRQWAGVDEEYTGDRK